MKTSSAKNKGRRLQKWLAEQIIAVFGLKPDDVRSTSSGAGGVDVLLCWHRSDQLVGICDSRIDVTSS